MSATDDFVAECSAAMDDRAAGAVQEVGPRAFDLLQVLAS